MKSKNRIGLAQVSGCALLCLLITFLIRLQITSGGNTINYFWHDKYNTGMDFFHSIEYVRTKKPYEQFEVVYPPLANLFFYLIYSFVAGSYPENTSETFWQSLEMVGTPNDLRLFQGPMMAFLIFIIGCISSMLFMLINRFGNKTKGTTLLSLGVISSYGILYCLERGNILLLSLVTLLFFLFNYDSKDGLIREMAIICLAISFGLKIYPAIFGLVLLKEKKYGLAIRSALYGLITLFTPLLFFEEGLDGLILWMKTMASFKPNIPAPQAGSGMNAILYSIQEMLIGYGIKLSNKGFVFISFAVFLFLLIMAFLLKKRWTTLTALTLAIILLQSQADYVYCLFLIPLLFFVEEEKTLTCSNVVPTTCLILLNGNIPVFYNYLVFYPRAMIAHILMLTMTTYIILITYKERHDARMGK